MAAPPTTYYDVLQVERGASAARVRAAYRRLARRYHPDRRPDLVNAGRAMAAINAAYEVLSDPRSRAEHDEWIAGFSRSRGEAAASRPLDDFRTFLRPVHSWSWFLLFGTIATVLATLGTLLFLGVTAQPRAARSAQSAQSAHAAQASQAGQPLRSVQPVRPGLSASSAPAPTRPSPTAQ